jgi:hypothetical protein
VAGSDISCIYFQDDEWEEVEDDDGDEDVEEQAEDMVTKPSNGLSSVFQPLSDMQHLLTDEVSLNLKNAFVAEK